MVLRLCIHNVSVEGDGHSWKNEREKLEAVLMMT